jgi:hypothetical protein
MVLQRGLQHERNVPLELLLGRQNFSRWLFVQESHGLGAESSMEEIVLRGTAFRCAEMTVKRPSV